MPRAAGRRGGFPTSPRRAAHTSNPAAFCRHTGRRARVYYRIQNAGTADEAAFDVAKDGEAALRALTGAAAAERRRIIASGGSNAAVAVAVAASVGKQ